MGTCLDEGMKIEKKIKLINLNLPRFERGPPVQKVEALTAIPRGPPPPTPPNL